MPRRRAAAPPAVVKTELSFASGHSGIIHVTSMVTENEQWPSLPYDEWKDTYATLHMWTQIVGKIALAQAAPLNHSWSVALLVTPRGLSTYTLPYGSRSFTMEFDFLDHRLMIRTSDGGVTQVALAPRSVADFYADVMTSMNAIGLPV